MIKEIQLLQLYKVSKGVYQTTDERFKIMKVEENQWSWFLKSGSAWIAKDKRQYRTKTQCERCVYAEVDNLFDDLQLWEG